MRGRGLNGLAPPHTGADELCPCPQIQLTVKHALACGRRIGRPLLGALSTLPGAHDSRGCGMVWRWIWGLDLGSIWGRGCRYLRSKAEGSISGRRGVSIWTLPRIGIGPQVVHNTRRERESSLLAIAWPSCARCSGRARADRHLDGQARGVARCGTRARSAAAHLRRLASSNGSSTHLRSHARRRAPACAAEARLRGQARQPRAPHGADGGGGGRGRRHVRGRRSGSGAAELAAHALLGRGAAMAQGRPVRRVAGLRPVERAVG